MIQRIDGDVIAWTNTMTITAKSRLTFAEYQLIFASMTQYINHHTRTCSVCNKSDMPTRFCSLKCFHYNICDSCCDKLSSGVNKHMINCISKQSLMGYKNDRTILTVKSGIRVYEAEISVLVTIIASLRAIDLFGDIAALIAQRVLALMLTVFV